MNDALAEFRQKQRQKYLERQRKDEEAKQSNTTTAPPPGPITTPPSSSTFPTTVAGVPSSTAQVSPNAFSPAAPLNTGTSVSALSGAQAAALPLHPSTSRDEEISRKMQEDEDERLARELAAEEERRVQSSAAVDDVRPPDTQFTERLIDHSAAPLPTAYTHSLFGPDFARPVQMPLMQRNDYHAYGSRPTSITRTVHMPPMGNINPLAPTNYAPGDAPTLRNDSSPPRHFMPRSDVSHLSTVHRPLISPHTSGRPIVTNRQPTMFARSPNHSIHSGSWASTPSPIPSDVDEDSRARQLREDEALARRMEEEWQSR